MAGRQLRPLHRDRAYSVEKLCLWVAVLCTRLRRAAGCTSPESTPPGGPLSPTSARTHILEPSAANARRTLAEALNQLQRALGRDGVEDERTQRRVHATPGVGVHYGGVAVLCGAPATGRMIWPASSTS
eukprot:CAMPEP_0196730334 /NCGR_PEP_ID=MMETSP1091-20130531/10411_1 /TAXON_ID=302021 /ORGANISM="Rhodomonas sp., Strain CCMP768" /LENGTH=128 /DNA_ID=CAMNT_0042073307 /DNA_START=42 /DNA_END=427 /DNA_ORIENTATION=-